MKLLKSLSSFIFPLIIVLMTFSMYLLVTKVVDNYKQSIAEDYSILVIANSPIDPIKKIAQIKVKNIQMINRENIIGEVKDKLSDSAIDLLSNSLPHFYKIYLEEFPTKFKLEKIKQELTAIETIENVETFSNDHGKIYSLLVLTKNVVVTLFIVVLISSFLLILQQIKIWFFEHNERIHIIQLHGGSLFYSAKPILGIITISVVLALIIVFLFMLIIISNISLVFQPEILYLVPQVIDLKIELIKVIILALIMPLIAFFGLLTMYRLQK